MDDNQLYDDFSNDRRRHLYLIISKFFLVFLVIAGLGIAIFSITYYTSNNFVTSIVPLNPISRSIEKGSGLIIERIKQTVKLENSGTYDVLSGYGTIIEHFTPNYPIVSLNISCIKENLNISYKCQNITTFVNGSFVLTADNSVILSPNPWNPVIDNAVISVNETYIRENLNLNTLSASTGFIMTLNPWNPTNGNSIITVNQTYINANLNLSSLNQGIGIIITSPSWNPSGSSASIAVNETYVYANINISSLNATNNITMSPSSPWNPLSSGNVVVQLNNVINQTFNQPYDQQGFFSIFNTTTAFGTANITGFVVNVPYTWTKGGFNQTSGYYKVPSSGVYEVNFRAICSVFTADLFIQVNGVSQYKMVLITTNTYYIITTLRVNVGDMINIKSSGGSVTITGSNGGIMPYVNYFGINKIGT